MPRAPKVCAEPGCPELTTGTRCPTHQRPRTQPAWAGSTRRRRLPADWNTRRRRILERDRHTCQRCGAHANQVDHINAGDDHSDGNLQALCRSCHQEKTTAEATAARRGNHRE